MGVILDLKGQCRKSLQHCTLHTQGDLPWSISLQERVGRGDSEYLVSHLKKLGLVKFCNKELSYRYKIEQVLSHGPFDICVVRKLWVAPSAVQVLVEPLGSTAHICISSSFIRRDVSN